MICRLWHGWTTPENADAYEALLRSEIFEAIGERGIPGYHGIELLRRPTGDRVEFVTLMWFDTIDSVRAFAGADYELAVVPARARALLLEFDERAAHFEVREDRTRGASSPAPSRRPT
jgi:antibiotic biosynthesis monooxygenase (ABM) superfamily enzyme